MLRPETARWQGYLEDTVTIDWQTPAVMDFLDVLVHSDDLEMWLEEVNIGPNSALSGVQLGEAQLRNTIGITVLAVRRAVTTCGTVEGQPDALGRRPVHALWRAA